MGQRVRQGPAHTGLCESRQRLDFILSATRNHWRDLSSHSLRSQSGAVGRMPCGKQGYKGRAVWQGWPWARGEMMVAMGKVVRCD